MDWDYDIPGQIPLISLIFDERTFPRNASNGVIDSSYALRYRSSPTPAPGRALPLAPSPSSRAFTSPFDAAFFVNCCKYRTFSYNDKLSFCNVWISPRSEEMTFNCFRKSSSNSEFRARKRSRCWVIMGKILVSGVPDLPNISSRDPMMELVGEAGRWVGARNVYRVEATTLGA